MSRLSALALLVLLAVAGCAPSAPVGGAAAASAEPAVALVANTAAAVGPGAAPVGNAAAPVANGGACGSGACEPGACGAAAQAAAAAVAVPTVGQQTFGAPLDAARALTPLAEIAGSPERYKDQVVKTDGEIARVCQAMGCWMELRASADATPVRVPMAGHAFFLPRDVAGRHATIEGRVAMQDLTPEARAHLAGEGAQAVASSLSIAATSVVID